MLAPLFTLDVRLAAPKTVHNGPHGERRVIDILGGTFTGARLSGEVLPGGADYQLVRPDGVAEIDVRATLRTDQADLVYLTGRGLRHGPAEVLRRLAAGEPVDPDSYYFRECLFFEAGDERTAWLNRVVTVARGARTRSSVKVEVFEVL
ncbi:DUF3237 domain-containing protein [Amycolatopsis rhabdoformis]|uniref:UPF0311 protein VSH64_47905 n=1 Tax=Amycolatopsis rhabdoformis TaxID=1448059 RepID=A0ABZ1I7M8_9PSEU|nr:DUF3237 domain-containing protein [Amycolatopsis rhabdoformis]WSE30433.1 DUF3237 domain-containing protein [Amycolatopsis rhabdoformis]